MGLSLRGDFILGIVLAAVGAAGIWDSASLPGGRRDDIGPGAFPLVVGCCAVVAGIALIARDRLLPPHAAARWSAMQLLVILIGIVVAVGAFSFSPWSKPWVLQWGPSELVALRVFELSVAIALARASHLRAVALVAMGFLLSVVGMDVSTGLTRLTFGIEDLVDGIDGLVLAPALFVVADAAICVYSPVLFLALYARQLRGWAAPHVSSRVALVMRVVAAAVFAASIYLAYAVNNRWDDLVLLALLGAFGVACRLYDWNRLVLLLAFSVGTMLEENIRRSLLLSRGDPAVFLDRPISAVLILVSCFVLAVVVLDRFRARGERETAT